MDRMLNSKREKESIYEIYRACRLCGGGAGYKMPIIQNIVDLDEADVELKQKIRDCVQIEVHQDDKMPPLICELCVDKVNDFYEFLEMCRQTNKRTRLRLGLPPQSLPRGAPDAGDCILGLTEPVFVNEDSDGEPLSKHKKISKNKFKKEPVVRIKLENLQEERSGRQKTRRSKTPPRVTRHSKSKDDDVALSSLQDKPKPTKMAPKSILKKDNEKRENSVKADSSSILSPRLKRSRDKEPVKLDTPPKKVKITIKPPAPQTRLKLSPRLSAKSPPPLPKSPPPRQLRSPAAPVKKPPTSSPPAKKEDFSCNVCGQQNKSSQARGSHLRSHVVTFTSEKLACNPCGEWFLTPEETTAHHKHHKSTYTPYSCRKCQADFKRLTEYDEHLLNNECLPSMEVPDVKCDVCWHTFATNNLMEQHKCLGADHRPGGKCNKCKRTYALLKNLQKHETTCTAKKKGEFIVNKELMGKLKPIQVRVARCDPLLTNVKQEHYDVSTVTSEYGLDTNCYYPYIGGIRIKSEFPGMVDIHDEIKREFCSEDYIHWDSTDNEEDEEEISCDAILNPQKIPKKRSVETLAALTLKIIFSQRLLGKVPKKKRKLKAEKVFDSLLNDQDDVRMDIGSLIDNLGDDDEKNVDDVSNISDAANVSSDNNVNDSNVNVSNGDEVNDDDDTNRLDNGKNSGNDINDGVDNYKNYGNDTNDSVDNDKNYGNDTNDGDDNDSQVSNNDKNISSNDSSVNLNKVDNTSEHTNSLYIDKNKSTDINKDDAQTKNVDIDDSYLDNLSQDSNSQSLLESDLLKSDSESNLDSSKNQNESQDSLPSNFDSKNINLDSKNPNIENNAAKTNVNLEFSVNKVQNNDRYNSDNRSILDEIDAQINDTNISNKIGNENENTNDSTDKIVLEDLLSKDTKIGLGSIEDYNFDS